MTCTRIFDYNTHLTSALVYAHCKQYGEIKELSIRRPMGFIASSFGGVHATFYDYPGEFITFTFTAIDRDYKLEKKLGIKP